MIRVLVVDDDKTLRTLLQKALPLEGYEVFTLPGAEGVLEWLEDNPVDAVLCDLYLPGKSGLELLSDIRRYFPHLPVIMVTGEASVETAVASLKMGAVDYIKKPFTIKEISVIISRAVDRKRLEEENARLREIVETKYSFSGLVGKTPQMKRVFELIRKVAPTDATVLIEGESGTGKELVAKAIHFNSPRKREPFVVINCGAVPETLLESELFGYKKGAFTGAYTAKKGLFEVARGGTIFLDEIGNTPLSIQAKLLRVLEDRTFLPLGATTPVSVNVRVISATNEDLEKAVEEGRFRQDLYYRLNVVKISLPPLRERMEDLPFLVSYFVDAIARRMGKNIEGVEPEVMDVFYRYHWPGNIRELENSLEHAIVLSSGKRISVEDLPPNIRSPKLRGIDAARRDWGRFPYKEAKQIFEKEYFERLLELTEGKVSQAARLCGLTRQHLHQKIRQYNIDMNRFRHSSG